MTITTKSYFSDGLKSMLGIVFWRIFRHVMSSTGVSEFYFFEDANGWTVTVNIECYEDILTS